MLKTQETTHEVYGRKGKLTENTEIRKIRQAGGNNLQRSLSITFPMKVANKMHLKIGDYVICEPHTSYNNDSDETYLIIRELNLAQNPTKEGNV